MSWCSSDANSYSYIDENSDDFDRLEMDPLHSDTQASTLILVEMMEREGERVGDDFGSEMNASCCYPSALA